MSISSILTEIKTEIKELKLTITEMTPAAKSTGSCQVATACSSGTDLLKNLSKATQDTSMLLEKSEIGLKGLTQTLKDTMSVKKDLEVWSQSVFKREENDKINEIHGIISSSNFRKNQADPAPNVSQNYVRHIPRSPSDTRTNSDIPGLSPNRTYTDLDGNRRTFVDIDGHWRTLVDIDGHWRTLVDTLMDTKMN